MPDYSVLYPGRFLSKEAIPAPKTIRIVSVNSAELENEKGAKEQKVTVKYKAADGEGEIVWCKTNAALTAIALNERDYTKWGGRLLTIYHDPNVMFGGKKLGGVRVFGSPEMTKPQTVEIKMPRKKKPDVYVLVPTSTTGHPLKLDGLLTPAQAAPATVKAPIVGEDIDPPMSGDEMGA